MRTENEEDFSIPEIGELSDNVGLMQKVECYLSDKFQQTVKIFIPLANRALNIDSQLTSIAVQLNHFFDLKIPENEIMGPAAICAIIATTIEQCEQIGKYLSEQWKDVKSFAHFLMKHIREASSSKKSEPKTELSQTGGAPKEITDLPCTNSPPKENVKETDLRKNGFKETNSQEEMICMKTVNEYIRNFSIPKNVEVEKNNKRILASFMKNQRKDAIQR